MKNYRETVLVTGGSGFLAAHCIVQLIQSGYDVRTTIRSSKRENDVRLMVRRGNILDDSGLSFTIANLTDDEGWAEAVKGCTYVLHTASPFPAEQPKDENELIIPARDGALRVLKAARAAKVKRVVLTSSFAAVGYSPKPADEPYTEADWTNLNQANLAPYIKSKTVAERAAWDFVKDQGDGLELSVINPTGIFGPALGPDFSSSLLIIKNMLNGTMQMIPNISTGVADVRDVADAHIKAMTSPAAAGERFIVCCDTAMTFPDMARVLRQGLGKAAAQIATHVGSEPGTPKLISNLKAKQVLNWQPCSVDETILDTGRSIIKFEPGE